MYVYVLSKDGDPLMPTKRCGWVRRALRDGRATVVRRTPFTIRLNYDAGSHLQEVTLGIDAGSKHIGLSASTEKEELFSATVHQRTDVKKKLDSRRELRRSRRSRELRHREARFLNRRRPEGWIPPSSRQKVLTHLSSVRLVADLLPVSRMVVEVGQFDPHRLKDPTVKGKGYQRGELSGWAENAKAYVRDRDGYRCRVCGSSEKLEVHHIRFRSQGGSDAPSNLVCLCHGCHGRLHAGKLTARELSKLAKAPRDLRDATWMNLVRPHVVPELAKAFPRVPVGETFGYETALKRRRCGLEKSHDRDAFCIAGNLEASAVSVTYVLRKLRRHNRSLHRARPSKGGVRRDSRCPHELFGFRCHDKVSAKGTVGHIIGLRRSGSFRVLPIDGSPSFDCTFRKIRHIETPRGFTVVPVP